MGIELLYTTLEMYVELGTCFHSMLTFSGSSGNEALLITRDDDVYALGPNTAGCLGVGNLQSTLAPKKIDVLCGKKVKGLYCAICCN